MANWFLKKKWYAAYPRAAYGGYLGYLPSKTEAKPIEGGIKECELKKVQVICVIIVIILNVVL